MEYKSFIETQFPISKLSKESYKERKGNQYTATLTGLGKWWGRKPLILVRAAIIGLLLPASDDSKKDRKIFLKILTMDEEGLWRRKTKSISLKDLYSRATPREKKEWFSAESTEEKPKYKKGLNAEQKEAIQKTVFMRMSYDEKLTYCNRPEQIDGPSEKSWTEINTYLGTKATNIIELVKELGIKRFSHVPKVGDAFCGGGSIPFEAARIGCNSYGSDLNPVGALLTWASLNIVSGSTKLKKQVKGAQKEILNIIDQQITEWDIEHNNKGWRADTFLYCNEVVDPESGITVPCLPSFVISSNSGIVAELNILNKFKKIDIKIKKVGSLQEIKLAKNSTTWLDGLKSPISKAVTSVATLRGPKGLRLWEKSDIIPRQDDIFQERLYCIRWVETCYDQEGKAYTLRHYLAPDENDLERERKVLHLIQDRFAEWQEKGFIPSRKIEPGYNTDQPIRERGWTHWHHLFNPRQLLMLGLMQEAIDKFNGSIYEKIALILWLGICCNFNSRISRWEETKGRGLDAFSNQALNTLVNYACRGLLTLDDLFNPFRIPVEIDNKGTIRPANALGLKQSCDLWLTDPPYADAINYHELSDFFLSWYEVSLKKLFPEWYTDSKRALAIVGTDEKFRKGMVDCYRNLAEHMPADGMQVVMFTHQDASVWADVTLILWAAGLRVTAAWCIATETNSALKEGNYVQGTVLLVLHKQTSEKTVFLDEIYLQIEAEVEKQLKSMLALEDDEDPNFGDADYQLAAYAAALRILTQYKKIEEIDVAYELSKPRKKGEVSPIEHVIANAVKAACDYLVPKGFDTFIWKSLMPEERLYLKGLEIESHGEFRSGVYQELARGFGIKDYKPLLESGKANQTRIKTASEFATKELSSTGFGTSLVRNVLFAIREVVRTEEVQQGKNWLRNEVKDYWNQRTTLIEILKYLSTMGIKIDHWQKDAEAANLLAGAVFNDHV